MQLQAGEGGRGRPCVCMPSPRSCARLHMHCWGLAQLRAETAVHPAGSQPSPPPPPPAGTWPGVWCSWRSGWWSGGQPPAGRRPASRTGATGRPCSVRVGGEGADPLVGHPVAGRGVDPGVGAGAGGQRELGGCLLCVLWGWAKRGAKKPGCPPCGCHPCRGPSCSPPPFRSQATQRWAHPCWQTGHRRQRCQQRRRQPASRLLPPP